MCQCSPRPISRVSYKVLVCVCVPHLSSVTFCAGFHVFVSTYTMTSLVPTHLPSTGAFEVCLTSTCPKTFDVPREKV